MRGMINQLYHESSSTCTYLNDGIGNLGTGYDGERAHHTIGILFTNLGDQKGTHTSASTTTKRVSDLETCKVTKLSETHVPCDESVTP